MALEEGLRTITLPANTDLSAKQYYFVKIANSSGTGQAAVCGDGEHAVGVLQTNDGSAQGDAVTVAVGGISKVLAGGTVTAGGPVASDANGKAVAAATGDIVLGQAVNSGVSGDYIPVLLDSRNSLANNIAT